MEDPAENINILINEFFNNLKVEHQYYSVQLKQPVLLIGEKNLHKAIKETIEKANNKH